MTRERAWEALGRTLPMSPSARLLIASGLFLASFAVKSLYAVDFAPLMYSHRQPGTRMAARYDEGAIAMIRGQGVLFPVPPDPADTGLLARPPGYSLWLAGVYRTIGRSYFVVQFAQNAVNSLSPIALFLLAGRLLTWRVGALAGLLAAASPPLSYSSNLVTPDSVCALPMLAALCLLVKHAAGEVPSWWRHAAAGALIGAAVWLRPNVMLLAPFLAVFVLPLSHRKLESAKRAAVMALASLAVVAPITIRNYVVYREFVPVSINGGISLWHGVAAAGGQRFGARSRDKLVIAEEALAHQNPAYEEWWAAPDGIHRDRLRYRMALGVIQDHPVWYARAMLSRMRDMLRYASGTPPLVKRSDEGAEASEREELVRAMMAGDRHGEPERSEGVQTTPDLRSPLSTRGLLRTGEWLSPLRLPVWTLQALTNAVMLGFIVTGAVAVLFLSWRTAVFLLLLPAYYFFIESIFFMEWRVVVPLHYSLFVFAATTWALAAALVREGARRAGNAVLGRPARTPA